MELAIRCENCDDLLVINDVVAKDEIITLYVERCECEDNEIQHDSYHQGFMRGKNDGI